MLPAEKIRGETANAGLTGRAAVRHVTASVTISTVAMTILNRTLLLTTTSDNALAVKLPPVADAAGMMFFIHFVLKATNNCTVNDDDDDLDFSQVTLDTQNDAFVFISDGIHWFCMDGKATS